MRWLSRSGKVVLCVGLLLAGLAAQARELRMQVGAIRSEAGSLAQVELRMHWPEGASQGVLELQAAALEVPVLGYSARKLAWSCPLREDPVGGWRCEGPVRLGGKAGQTLAVHWSDETVLGDLQVGRSRLRLTQAAATPERISIQLQKVPVVWLQAFAQSLWAAGRWPQGRLDGEVVLDQSAAGTQADARLEVADLALETPDGLIAGAGIGGQVRIRYRSAGDRTSLHSELGLRGGELLAGNFYARLPTSRVEVAIDAEQRAGQPWRLPRFHWRDGDVLVAEGSASFDDALNLDDLELDLAVSDLAIARDRYLSGFLAPAGFPDMVLGGGLQAQVSVRDTDLHALHFQARQLNAIDPRQRFVLAGLQGDLRWTAEAQARPSHLEWSSGALYGIGLGAAGFDLVSAEGEVELHKPSDIAVLQGKVRLEQLRWRPATSKRGTRFQLGVTMDQLDLTSLSQRLGWPPFTGTLGGRIPMARYERGVLALDGGLQMDLFGGRIELSELVMERPFGIAPTLSADVGIDNLDLMPLTEVFGFGSISGRLDGSIRKLRLVDWSPVAFEARLDTDTEAKGKRRISQRAVQDISSIAGSGLLAGLQAQALRLFEDFGYARIGLGCTLRDNVCRMDGTRSSGDSYTIVEGAGLPRIQVVGFRRRVDWPTLVSRLIAVTEGQRPVFE